MKDKILIAIGKAFRDQLGTNKKIPVILSLSDWGELSADDIKECLIDADKVGVEMIFVPDNQETDS